MSEPWLAHMHEGCVALAAIVCAGWAWCLVARPPQPLVTALASHVEATHRRLVALRWPISGRFVVACQAAILALAAVVAVLVEPGPALVVASLPWALRPVLDSRLNERIAQLDLQLEPWLRALAGGLASGASLGQALEESIGLVERPLREEVQQVCRDTTLGASVSEALQRMAVRIDSAALSTAVAAIRIGQRSGGGLPYTLRESAATLREMARLEGVVRTRTAEARAQATVVGLVPVPMVGFIHYLNPALMEPLWEHPQGVWVVALAVVFWIASILLARRILDVDI